MYSGRQRDLRERRSHQEWDAPGGLDHDGALETDDAREVESPRPWTVQLHARAGAA
jgi:hypothetical protein